MHRSHKTRSNKYCGNSSRLDQWTEVYKLQELRTAVSQLQVYMNRILRLCASASVSVTSCLIAIRHLHWRLRTLTVILSLQLRALNRKRLPQGD
jgi:hypothetical protein